MDNSKRDWSPFIWVVLVIVAWLLSPWLVNWVVTTAPKDTIEFGTFGDSFGALTSLFTGLAFVGLIITLRQQKVQIEMQRQDLKLQRGEMKAAREELAGQKGQMELQNQSLKQQMFEQTFFNLLNVFNSYIADLVQTEVLEGGEPKKGRDQLEEICKELTNASRKVRHGPVEMDPLGGIIEHFRELGDEEYLVAVVQRFQNRYIEYANDLNSYFRLLYNLIRLVDESSINTKKRYVDILRAQLSDSELLLIALNSERPEGAKLKERATRYNLLKHLPKTINDLPTVDVCKAIGVLSKAERGTD
ncbi:putative phage abortive infection protein [Epibacterium ulvae]|uniref:putative phage abortive infection protein n=1 Tax=Epibacterium ulvae TaxID=1156985 RepID=UPI00248F5E8A|nr:putative phage abortive infection protein [Epibacterium ulvae]